MFPLLNDVISVPKTTSQAQRKRHFLPPPGFWLLWPLASVPVPPLTESICRIPHAPWRQNPSLKSVPLLNPTSRSSGRAPDCYSKTSYPWAAVWGGLAACRAVTRTGSLTDTKGPSFKQLLWGCSLGISWNVGEFSVPKTTTLLPNCWTGQEGNHPWDWGGPGSQSDTLQSQCLFPCAERHGQAEMCCLYVRIDL